jgi:hypothetical protein
MKQETSNINGDLFSSPLGLNGRQLERLPGLSWCFPSGSPFAASKGELNDEVHADRPLNMNTQGNVSTFRVYTPQPELQNLPCCLGWLYGVCQNFQFRMGVRACSSSDQTTVISAGSGVAHETINVLSSKWNAFSPTAVGRKAGT